ncbi:peptidase family C78-domain-containing protein [Mycotypha africana]|uniref:peptidase family C78-domain-containing protein n=1 Tax=Mycotypha africana TaxID=64632 RepID=UPI0023012A3B|nr:peptidase family C78-domain-containing protein [Mycotypha africana]KAI8981733.1 peptidase family C78-domain-containing protein [Mycotypha africana]
MTQTTHTLTTEDVKISLKRKKSTDDSILMEADNNRNNENEETTTSHCHLDKKDTMNSLHKKPRPNSNSRTVRSILNEDKYFWNQLTVLNKECRTSGIIPRLEPDFKKADTLSAYLCSPLTDHLSTGFMDLGWGCGYRNCQMLMSYLERKKVDGEPLLKNVFDIHGIQLLIERAWKEGFDSLGAAQLDHHVFKTRKWIGTTEVYTLLTYLGIRSTIIDFHHPGPKHLHQDLLDWIQSYFMDSVKEKENNHHNNNSNHPNHKKNNVYITNRPPIYLQHQGHSRTVIGIEILKSGKRNLIMFDPGRRVLRSYRNQPPPSYAEDSEEDDLEDVHYTEREDENDPIEQQHHNISGSGSNTSSPLSSGTSYREDDALEDEDEEIDIISDMDTSSPIPAPAPARLSSSLSPSNTTNTNTSTAKRFLAKIKLPSKALHSGNTSASSSSSSSSSSPSSSLLRPFRVDDKTLGKHKQYSVLVIGHVEQNENGKMAFDSSKSLLLNEEERERMKNVTSLTVI